MLTDKNPEVAATALERWEFTIDEISEMAADGTVDFAIATEGLAAAWQKLVEYIGSLKDMVINAIRDWVVTKIVTSAITKLVTMFNPVGAIVQAVRPGQIGHRLHRQHRRRQARRRGQLYRAGHGPHHSRHH